MAKNFFQHVEIVELTGQKFEVKAPVFKVEEPVSSTPSEEDVLRQYREEAEAFKKSWEAEKLKMNKQSQYEAERIRTEAEESSREMMRASAESADQERQKAEAEARRIKAEAEDTAKRIVEEAEARRDEMYAETHTTARKEASEEGWKEGKAEVDRLVERLHSIINSSIQKRREIIEDVEIQLIDLVLLISRKVIKTISEKQKNVVTQNIIHALKKIKARGDVAIRVNLGDLELTTRHTEDFLAIVENSSIKVLEDSSVDKGGAVIETDFGQIDARIHSQLREIEEKILEIIPIKSTEES